MKKRIWVFFLTFIILVSTLSLTSCSGTPEIEDIIVEFWMSSDGGETYSQGVFEHPGFGSVFLKLRIQIHTNKTKASFHNVTLSIGESENIDARIIGGPPVNPRSVLSDTLYDFTTRGVKDNDGYTELFVEFLSYGEGRIEMLVEFDSSVPDGYNRKHTVIMQGSQAPPTAR